MRTGQSVRVQHEFFHSRAESELRRDCTCAARWSFLDCGILVLVYRSINLSEKVLTGELVAAELELRHVGQLPNLGRDGACQRIFSRKSVCKRRDGVGHGVGGRPPQR